MVTQIGNSLLLYFGNIMKNFERSRIFFVVLHGILDFFAVVLLSWTYDDMKSTLTDFLSIMWTLYISISATSLFLMMYVMIKPENSVIKSYMIFTEKFHENTLINIILIDLSVHFCLSVIFGEHLRHHRGFRVGVDKSAPVPSSNLKK